MSEKKKGVEAVTPAKALARAFTIAKTKEKPKSSPSSLTSG